MIVTSENPISLLYQKKVIALLKIHIFLTFILLNIKLYSQNVVYKIIPPQYEIEHVNLQFKTNPGVFQNVVEDKEGNLWILSTEGLHVYDGQQTITYRNDSKEYFLGSKSNLNFFTTAVLKEDGNIWVAEKQGGFFQFNPYKRSTTDSFEINISNGNKLNHVFYNKRFGLYISQFDYDKNQYVLYQYEKKSGFKKLLENNVYGNRVQQKMTDKYFWTITSEYAEKYALKEKKSTKYYYPHKSALRFLTITGNNKVYFLDQYKSEVYTFNEALDKFEVFLKIPIINDGKGEAFFIHDDKFYLGSHLNLYIIDLKANTFQDISPQLTELSRQKVPSNLGQSLNQFFLQKDGTILLITPSNIFRLKKKMPQQSAFRQKFDIEKPFSLPLSFRALAEDEDKNIYASFYNAFAKKKKGHDLFVKQDVTQILKGDNLSTYSLNYWKGHLLWNNVKINLTTGKYTYLFDTIFSGHTTQYLQKDSLWLYKWNTNLLHCYDLKKNRLKSFNLELSNTSNGKEVLLDVKDMNDMIADISKNKLWISGHSFGLCQISKQGSILKKYNYKDLGTTDNYITDLELVGAELWFGCSDGLGMLNIENGKPTIFRNSFFENGLIGHRAIFSIQKDTLDNFYLGSSKGILYFDTKSKRFFNLPERHPLASPEFNRAAVLRTADNKYYFGSTDGLYAFTPSDLEYSKSSNAINPIKLISASVFNTRSNTYNYLSQNLDAIKVLNLNSFDNNIVLTFSVPEFYQNMYYSYRIKGHIEHWTEYKHENKIQLYGLQPGYYTLEVKASTNLSEDNVSRYSLDIEMKQIWYKKWWVISLFFIAVLTLIIGFLRYRFHQKISRHKELAALRTKISSDLHDDVGTILSGLAMQSQMLSFAANEEQKVSLREISNMSRDAMDHMRDTVWAIDSRKDKFENLIDRMKAFAEKNLPMKNMTHEFIIENINPKKFIDPDKRQSIYLIFKEAITNIVKHSDGSHVIIQVKEEKNKMILTIKDNGNKTEQNSSDGMGLSNMKLRAEKIGGILTTQYESGFYVLLVIQ